jgi:uncharacterized integral membrane protein
MTAPAAIRPDQWDLPLFLHVLGALTLIGTLALTSAFLFAAWRDGSPANLRLALRSLTLGVIPAWLILRVSAEWIADKEGINDLDKPPAWIDIGYIASDLSFLLIVITSLLGWFTLRRARAGGTAEPSQAARTASVLIARLLILSLVALWAMTTKPV